MIFAEETSFGSGPKTEIYGTPFTTNPKMATDLSTNLMLCLQADSKLDSIKIPAWQLRGTLFVSLKTVIDHLGGAMTWNNMIQKIMVQGPSGKRVDLVMGYPKIVINKQKLARLPHVPLIKQGNVIVSIESLIIIWQEASAQLLIYDPAIPKLQVGARPAVINKTITGKNLQTTMASSKIKGIVIVDAGHGGKDPGAIGPTQLQEKVVTLEIAEHLKSKLESIGLKVIMTRTSDEYISLPQRAKIANQKNGDLFISIHANASSNRKACGSEIFIYNREASSRRAAEAARLENMDANYLEVIKDDLRQSIHEEVSITVAGLVGEGFEKSSMSIRKIERAPFYVLAKSSMPAILVETAFISNAEEEKKLRDHAFCHRMAVELCDGIKHYFLEKGRRNDLRP